MEMGVHPSDYLPVTYKSDSTFIKSFFIHIFPTALLIGAIFFMSRKASGAKGAGVRGIRRLGRVKGI